MKNVKDLKNCPDFVLTDIDDTLTNEGQLHADAYAALWNLKRAGFQIIPVTGRPAGWCEMIARFWPVDGIVGENGGFYFRYHDRKMKRAFSTTQSEMSRNRKKLSLIENEILKTVKGSAVASDQFSRLMDLAIDFCEDVPALSKKDVQKIVSMFEKHGAIAKVSSIHVNGWFGTYNKISMLRTMLKDEFGLSEKNIKTKCIFVGDSPNDEPMFEYFKNSVGVANIKKFIEDLKSPPTFVTKKKGGEGFVELSDQLLKLKKNS